MASFSISESTIYTTLPKFEASRNLLAAIDVR